MNDSLRLRAREARVEIESGALRGEALIRRLLTIPFRDRDVWVDTVLGFELPPPDTELPRGSVPYLPCGVDEILAMVLDVPVRTDDTLVDLGSGLGRVVILAHLLSGARACGVEIQEHLVHRARARCDELGLSAVTFVRANAAEIDLDGSIFFLYAPFNGVMLTDVLGRLEAVTRRRQRWSEPANAGERGSIVVCAVGLELDDVPWLQRRKSSSVALALYVSRDQ